MIGLQELIIKENIVLKELAKYLDVTPSGIKLWFKKQRVPEKYFDSLYAKFKVDKSYFNQIVSNEKFDRRRKGFNDYKIDKDITTIYIKTKDKHANGEVLELLIDTDKLLLLESYNRPVQVMWNNNTKSFYARFYMYNGKDENGKVNYKTIYIHRLITDAKEDDYVDHINYNSMDNRLCNLRVTVNNLNLKHRDGKNSNNKSGYRNVFWETKGQRWIVKLMVDGKPTDFGRFKDVHEAGRVAEQMREKYYGEFKGYS